MPRDCRWRRPRCGRKDATRGQVSILDPDAGFARRGERGFFGIGSHLAVGLGSDLVRGAILTSADVGDSLAADALAQSDEDVVFANKAYDSAGRRQALAEAGIVDAIMHRGHARLPLAPCHGRSGPL